MYAMSARRVNTSTTNASSKDGTAAAKPNEMIGSSESRESRSGNVDCVSHSAQAAGGVS